MKGILAKKLGEQANKVKSKLLRHAKRNSTLEAQIRALNAKIEEFQSLINSFLSTAPSNLGNLVKEVSIVRRGQRLHTSFSSYKRACCLLDLDVETQLNNFWVCAEVVF